MSQGIYKITNKINNKCYIGKSSNIEGRWKYHIKHKNTTSEYNKLLYQAFRKYGIENFSFEIIEEINDCKIMNEREKFWIQYYDCYGGNKGYNATPGGDGGVTCTDPREKYGKLTSEEVIYLRKRYAECKYPASYIYNLEFKNKITLRGFQAIWLGQNARNIMPEVFTQENKQKQIKLNRRYEGILRRRITLQEIKDARERIAKGETKRAIWKEKYQTVYSEGGFRDVLKAIHLDEEVTLDGTICPL